MDSHHEDLKYTIETELFIPLPYKAAKGIVEMADDEVRSQLEYDKMRLLEDLEAAKEDSLMSLQNDSDRLHLLDKVH
jgi:hypothetical protein